MSALTGDRDPRRVVPRWRDAHTAITTGELDPIPVRDPSSLIESVDDALNVHVRDWESHESIGFAADLVSAAIVLDRGASALSAARYITRHKAEAGDVAYMLATRLLAPSRETARDEVEVELGATSLPDRVRASTGVSIAALRSALRRDPHNAIAWLDLSRLYARVGSKARAMRAMQAAVSLAPDHRFVLRSAARLSLHRHDPDEALAILRHSSAMKEDPWLLAAEIAIATVADRVSRHIKLGRSLIASGRFSPFQTSELASAIATVDANAGTIKAAKQMFRSALREPTENTVAQAQWFARQAGLIQLEASSLNVPRSFEAQAWLACSERRWDEAILATWAWLDDEPFAGRPAVLGTTVAAVALNDPGQALRFVQLGLLANPASDTLRNNEVFALILLGQLDRARSRRADIQESRLTEHDHAVYLANSGLLAFRGGDVETGRNYYRATVAIARQKKNQLVEGVALAFWAAEEFRRLVSGKALRLEIGTPVPDDPQANSGETASELASKALGLLRTAGRSVDRDLAELHLQRANSSHR
jgi:tetratricopeptide (TPR) repeat protein